MSDTKTYMADIPFAMIARTVAVNPNIPPSTKAVLLALAAHADNHTGTCWPTRKTLAAETGLSIPTVRRALDQLRSLGIVKSRPQGQHRPSLYRIIVAPEGSTTSPRGVTNEPQNYTQELNSSVSQHPSDAVAVSPVSQQPAVAAAPEDDNKSSRRRAVRLMAESLQQLEDSLKDETQCDTTAMDALEIELGMDRIVGNDMTNTNVGEWLLGIRDDNGGGLYGAGAALNSYLSWADKQPF